MSYALLVFVIVTEQKELLVFFCWRIDSGKVVFIVITSLLHSTLVWLRAPPKDNIQSLTIVCYHRKSSLHSCPRTTLDLLLSQNLWNEDL